MFTYLLIHGGMQGGWCWERIIPLLKKNEHKIIAPCLTGLGSKAHLLTPAVNLSTHVQDIINIIDKDLLKNVILIGHSYGGMVAIGVAAQRHQVIKKIFYVDAVLAEPGQSMATAILPDIWAAIQQKAILLENVWQIPAMTCEEYGFEKEEDKNFVKEKSTAQPLACFTEPLFYDMNLHEKISAHYIFSQKSLFLNNMKERSKNMKIPFQTINAGHFSMIEIPEFLTKLIQLNI